MKNTSRTITLKKSIFIILHIIFAIASLLIFFLYIGVIQAEKADSVLFSPLRGALSYITSSVSLPIFEFLIAISPILVMLAIRKCAKMRPSVALSSLFLFAELLFVLYGATVAAPSLKGEKSSHGVGDVADFELVLAFETLESKISECEVAGARDSLLLMSESQNAAKMLQEKIQGRIRRAPRPKFSLLSEFLTEANILAYYSFPTSEILINNIQPIHSLPVTVCHEIAHYYGIMQEDEANLYAYMALSESADMYLRYCAYISAFEYLAMPIYKISKAKYSEIYSALPEFARRDIDKSRTFLNSLGGGSVGKLSDAANDKALSVYDERGGESYSETARLLAKYILSSNSLE